MMKNVKVHHLVFIESEDRLYAGQYVRQGAGDKRIKILHVRSKLITRDYKNLYECIIETDLPYELWEVGSFG